MKTKTTKEKVHLLRLDSKLFQRIEKSQRKYRPYLKSRNYFLIELIEVGLEQFDRETKLYGGQDVGEHE